MNLKKIFEYHHDGASECLEYWRIKTPLGGVRLHHWKRDDRDDFSHDHPWSFATLVLFGGYTDVASDGSVDCLRAGSVRFRSAEHRHTVKDCAGCWTIVVMGPTRRDGHAYIGEQLADWHEWLRDVCAK
jgi:hypothetical protein